MDELFQAITKSLVPAIDNKDASLVSCSDKKELATVKQNFLIKKLALKEGPNLDDTINTACETIGTANRYKYKAIFYTLLVSIFNKEAVFIIIKHVPLHPTF